MPPKPGILQLICERPGRSNREANQKAVCFARMPCNVKGWRPRFLDLNKRNLHHDSPPLDELHTLDAGHSGATEGSEGANRVLTAGALAPPSWRTRLPHFIQHQSNVETAFELASSESSAEAARMKANNKMIPICLSQSAGS